MSNTDEDLKQKSFLNLVLTGKRLLMSEQFQRARHIFTSALELQPEDKECLIGRSKCYMNEGRLRKALQDAELSLRHDKSFPEGLYQKAQVLYSLGELEFSLQLYHQGQHIRPQMQCFELGIQRAQDAIENSVGSLTNAPLKVGGDLSFLEKMELRTHPIKIIQNLMEEEKTEAPEVLKKKQTTPNLLKDFDDPKTLLEDVVKHGDLLKEKTKSGEEVKEIVEDLLMSVNTYKEICNQENMVAPPEKKKKPQQPEAEGITVSKCEEFLLRSFREIIAELKSGDEESGLKKAKGAVKFAQRRSEMELPPAKPFLGSLDGFIGDALLCRRANEMQDRQNEHDLTEQCKLPDAKSRAEGGNLQQTAELWKKRIPLAHDSLEKVRLLHKIGSFYLELHRYEDAREYALLSVAQAAEVSDEEWRMKANVLMAESELKLGNVKSSVSHFEKALAHARLQNDDSAPETIQKALDEAKQCIKN